MTQEKGSSFPPVTIVIVTFNSASEIEKCILSLGERPQNLRVVVVDNASSDSTPRILRALTASGQVDEAIYSTTNFGFAKAVNIGMTLATGDVLLLNPDAQISVASIQLLSSLTAADPSIGIVAPVVDSGPRVSVMSAGRQPRIWPMLTHATGLARLFPGVRSLRGRHLYLKYHSASDQEVEWVSGCCMYMSSHLIDRIGPLSERWFMYGEDIEYCQRAINAGYRVVVRSSATATHLVGASVRKASGPITSMWARNTYDYYVTQYQPNALSRFTWRIVFSGLMLSRAAVHRAKAIASPSAREDLLARASTFEGHTRAVWE